MEKNIYVMIKPFKLDNIHFFSIPFSNLITKFGHFLYVLHDFHTWNDYEMTDHKKMQTLQGLERLQLLDPWSGAHQRAFGDQAFDPEA